MGCNKGYDLVNRTFDRLTVLKDTGERNPKKGKVWLCLCKCGNKKEVTTSNLTSGRTKSCGCLQDESRKRKRPKRKQLISKKRKKEIPPELKSVSSKIVKNGLFQVFENGRIFRITEHGKEECSYIKNNQTGYCSVSRMVDGKQKPFYVHRLLAIAFVPNPTNKPLVAFKDNDRTNLSIDNLVWRTHSEQAQIMYQKKIIDPYAKGITCKVCGVNTRNEDHYCFSCRSELQRKEKRRMTKQKRIDEVSHIDFAILTKRQREICELRKEGKTIGEIAEEVGITRQGVSSILKTAQKRAEKYKEFKKQKQKEQDVFSRENDLKILRKRHMLTQTDLAELLNITPSTYGNKEKGVSEFTVSEAIQLANLFDKTVEEMFS